jgi:hypothetical protein
MAVGHANAGEDRHESGMRQDKYSQGVSCDRNPSSSGPVNSVWFRQIKAGHRYGGTSMDDSARILFGLAAVLAAAGVATSSFILIEGSAPRGTALPTILCLFCSVAYLSAFVHHKQQDRREAGAPYSTVQDQRMDVDEASAIRTAAEQSSVWGVLQAKSAVH